MQENVQALEFESELCRYFDFEKVASHASVCSSVKWGGANNTSQGSCPACVGEERERSPRIPSGTLDVTSECELFLLSASSCAQNIWAIHSH